MFLPPSAEGAPLTGLRLKVALASPVMRSWTELPLRSVLDQLGATRRVSIFLDRRVDPGQETSLDALNLPLDKTLDQLADMVNTKMVPFSSILYIGPEETARLLPALAASRRDEVRKLPDRGRAMLTSKSMRWDDLSTPRELLQALATETGVPIEPIESIPHDLWAGMELPSTTAVDRLTLILSQFDKTFSISNDASGKPRLLIIDITEQMKLSALQAAEAQKATKSTRTIKRGRSGATASSTKLANIRIKRFAVKENPVGLVLEYLARQWKLTLEVDREKYSEKLKQRISLTEENVTVPELIRAVLKPVDLEGELDEQAGVLRIKRTENRGQRTEGASAPR